MHEVKFVMHPDQKIAAVMAVPKFARRWIMFRHYRKDIDDRGEVELGELRNLVTRGDLAIDIGCNLGVYAYELARLTRRVVAFEPNPKLARLVSSLGIDGLEVRQMALSSSSGSAELMMPTSGSHQRASLRANLLEDVERVAVPTRTLDGCRLHQVAFIKIDVEGFEEEVLAGAIETITRDRPKLLIEIEERHNPGGLARCRKSFAALGYECRFFWRRAWHTMDAFEPAVHHPTGKVLEERLREAPSRRDLEYVNNFLFLPT